MCSQAEAETPKVEGDVSEPTGNVGEAAGREMDAASGLKINAEFKVNCDSVC